VETDGQLKTGRDIAIAALLGAEEFGFSTAPLVTLGCIMMRVCHLNTCPAGIATQNPELRATYTGDPAHTVNFMRFIAQDLREIMAALGFRTLNEMVGRTDVLESKQAIAHWKAKNIDLSNLLYQPEAGAEVGRYQQIAQDRGLDKSLDITTLLDLCKDSILDGKPTTATLPICNVNRAVGTILGNEITKNHWHGLPEDTVHLKFQGSAGQSFGAFIPTGVTLELEGDANILDEQSDFATRCNTQMVGLETLSDAEEIGKLKGSIEQHVQYTKSQKAIAVLANWDEMVPKFVKVMPRDYRRALQAIQNALASGLSGDDALNATFEENSRDVARIGGS
jgi:hypothetical protein